MRRLALVAAPAALALAGSAAAGTLPGFHSPSGNIRCLLLGGTPPSLLCQIGEASYAKALQAGCMAKASVDWHGFMLAAARKASPVCSGGILYTQRPRWASLPYGTSWHRASFTCESRVTGVTCRSASGHGLFLARASWRAW